jgi:hypothetical protein
MLLEDGTAPIAGRSTTMNLGHGLSRQSCISVAPTDDAGRAVCTIPKVNQPLGPGAAAAEFNGDAFYLSSSDEGSTVVFQPGEAFAASASGLLSIPRTPLVQCPPGGSATQVALDILSNVVSVRGLNASCSTDPTSGTTTLSSSVASVTLLGGKLLVTGIQSECSAAPSGITGSSSVATLNGQPIGSQPVSISVAGVAQVFLNETTTNADGLLVQNAIRIVLGAGQQIILGSCSFTD